MISKLRQYILDFVNSKKEVPIIAGIAAGLYPFLHYCNANFTYIETTKRVFEFLGIFIVLPVLVCYLALLLTSSKSPIKSLRKLALTIVNFTAFCFLIIVSVAGLKSSYIIIGLLIAISLALLFYKHLKKIVVVQFLMALFVMLQLVRDVYGVIIYDDGWKDLPDNIEQVLFKKHPNIYLIQPDGYANFSELQNELYDIDNHKFEDFLSTENFKLYQNHRSNYTSTLYSNASLFMMKHHYYNFNRNIGSELRHARHMIVGNNPVHAILKNNGYKTHLIVDSPYFLVNRPDVKYDYCNVEIEEIPYFSKGFDFKKDVFADFKLAYNSVGSSKRNFFFIERYLPGHIATHANKSKNKSEEKKLYQERLKDANHWLRTIVNEICTKDPEGIVIIMADHGGYVGFNYTEESKTKQTDKDLVYSMFTTALAIKWPNDDFDIDEKLKTNVNLFRVLFSYLSEDKMYLNNLEQNSSFGVIKNGAPLGVYELVNEKGDLVFEAIKN